MVAKVARQRFSAGDLVGGRYRVVRVIATGGMAEVYEVIDEQAGGRWALKTPNATYAHSRRIVARMVREAQALAKMDDPNLVKVHDAGEHEGQFFMVMAYLDGVTLSALAKDRPLPLGVILSLVRQVALALHILHVFRHVHRDIKPDNIIVLVNEGGAFHLAVLIDLGIAKIADISTTNEGGSFGTPTYMAPEQALGQGVDARADIYSLSLILYELVAGCHPHTIKSRPASKQEWIRRQIYHDPDPLSLVVPGLHPSLSNLVLRGMAKVAAQRFASAADLVEHIDQVVQALRVAGQLGATRLDPFMPPEPLENESGPQPIAIRPEGGGTPDAGLPYRRTDIPSGPSSQEAPCLPAPLPFAPEPPRVSQALDARTVRNTVRMLGPRMTLPNLDAPRASAPVIELGGQSVAARQAALLPAGALLPADAAAPFSAPPAPQAPPPLAPVNKDSKWQPTRREDALFALAEPPDEESEIFGDAPQPRPASVPAKEVPIGRRLVVPGSRSTAPEQPAKPPVKEMSRAGERTRRMALQPSISYAALKGALVGIVFVALALAVVAVIELREGTTEQALVTPAEQATATAEESAPLLAAEPTPPLPALSLSSAASSSGLGPRIQPWGSGRARPTPTSPPPPPRAAPPAKPTSYWTLDDDPSPKLRSDRLHDDPPSAKPHPSALDMPFHAKKPSPSAKSHPSALDLPFPPKP